MSRAPSRVRPSHLVAAVLAVTALLDLASGLGLLPHRTAPSRAPAVAADHRPVRAAPTRGTRALRVVVPSASVRARDRVDVLVTLDPDRYPSDEPTRTVAEALTVLAVDRAAPGADERGVTLAVPRAIVPRVAFAATAGTVTLAVVPDRRGA